MKIEEIIKEVFAATQFIENQGEPASYIPELSKVDSNHFGVHYASIDGTSYGEGDYQMKFSMQSIAKVLSFAMAYKILDEHIWDRVGVEPSGTSFNSLVQLEADRGIPRNPFMNSGAIVIADILISHFNDARTEFLDFVRTLCDNTDVTYSTKIVESEKAAGFRNRALCNFLKSFGNLRNDPLDVLDLYFNICSLEVSCQDLTAMFLFLANNGIKVSTGSQILTTSQNKRINALMQTCGFYDESGEFAFKVGLPGKSGVGGGIIAIHPGKYAIAVWSPRLNKKGNSFKGMRFLEAFTTKSNLSIF